MTSPHVLFVGLFGLLAISFNGAAAGSDECLCSCVKNVIPEDPVERAELVEQEVEKIKEELYVNTDTLVATIYKKKSVDDERPTAKNVGYMGVAMLSLAGCIILAMDANYAVSIGHSIYNFFKSKCKSTS